MCPSGDLFFVCIANVSSAEWSVRGKLRSGEDVEGRGTVSNASPSTQLGQFLINGRSFNMKVYGLSPLVSTLTIAGPFNDTNVIEVSCIVSENVGLQHNATATVKVRSDGKFLKVQDCLSPLDLLASISNPSPCLHGCIYTDHDYSIPVMHIM